MSFDFFLFSFLCVYVCSASTRRRHISTVFSSYIPVESLTEAVVSILLFPGENYICANRCFLYIRSVCSTCGDTPVGGIFIITNVLQPVSHL